MGMITANRLHIGDFAFRLWGEAGRKHRQHFLQLLSASVSEKLGGSLKPSPEFLPSPHSHRDELGISLHNVGYLPVIPHPKNIQVVE